MRVEAIVEVMVDLLLEMERMTAHKGLVYVLDEGLESYPVSGVAKRQFLLGSIDVNVSICLF